MVVCGTRNYKKKYRYISPVIIYSLFLPNIFSFLFCADVILNFDKIYDSYEFQL